MKRIILPLLLILFYSNILFPATNIYDMIKSAIIMTGKQIEMVENVPFINKLTNFLPFNAIATSFQQCPGQSLLLVAGLITYVLYKNEVIEKFFPSHKVKHSQEDDSFTIQINSEDLFIFDGDDADDAMEQEDTEDELLDAKYRTIRKGRIEGSRCVKV